MKDKLKALDGFLERIEIPQVANNSFTFKVGEVSGVARRPHQQAEISALRGKKLRNVAADKSGCSGDEYFHKNFLVFFDSLSSRRRKRTNSWPNFCILS